MSLFPAQPKSYLHHHLGRHLTHKRRDGKVMNYCNICSLVETDSECVKSPSCELLNSWNMREISKNSNYLLIIFRVCVIVSFFFLSEKKRSCVLLCCWCNCVQIEWTESQSGCDGKSQRKSIWITIIWWMKNGAHWVTVDDLWSSILHSYAVVNTIHGRWSIQLGEM